MADGIKANSKRFRTVAEVRRAADHIGMMVLFEMFGDPDHNDHWYGGKLYQLIKANDKFFKELGL